MKTSLLNCSKKVCFGLVVVLFFALIANSFAQNQSTKDLGLNKNSSQSLVMAIHSDNTGVRESSIYLVGKYRISDLEDELISQLKVEKDSDIKVLIGLALFRMSSEKGMKELQMLTAKDENPRVRRMSYAIYNEYLVNSSNRTVDVK